MCASICPKAGSQVRGRLLIHLSQTPGEMPSGICAVHLDAGLWEQLKTIIQLWPLNQGFTIKRHPSHSTKQSVAALSFYNEQGCTQAANRQNER